MAITIRAKKIRTNKLLSRKQAIIEVFHEGKPNLSLNQIKQLLVAKYKWDAKCIVPFGFRTVFGGCRSTGFALIYDNQQFLVKYEPDYRLRRSKILPKKQHKRKAEKQLKRKIKKSRGGAKRQVQQTRKAETRADIKKAKTAYLQKILIS